MLYDDDKGGEGKKERVSKECASVLQQGIYCTCQGFMPRWPQLSKPFASFAKIPTRDPEILPCYWIYVVNALILIERTTYMHIYTHAHTHNRKNYPVSCAYTFRNLYCTSFLLPKCSISIREGNGKFACTCTKAHIIHEGNKYVKWMGFWFSFSC